MFDDPQARKAIPSLAEIKAAIATLPKPTAPRTLEVVIHALDEQGHPVATEAEAVRPTLYADARRVTVGGRLRWVWVVTPPTEFYA